MSRVWKRFFYKIRMPVLIPFGLLVVSGSIHIGTDQYGSSFTEVVAAVLLFLFYLIGFVMIAAIPIALLLEAYGRARTEIEEENETLIRALKND